MTPNSPAQPKLPPPRACEVDPLSSRGLRELGRNHPVDWGTRLRRGLRPAPQPSPGLRVADLTGTVIDEAVAPSKPTSIGTIAGARAISRIIRAIPLDTPVVRVDASSLDSYESTLRSRGVPPSTARKVVGRVQQLVRRWAAHDPKVRLRRRIRRPRVDHGAVPPLQVTAMELARIYATLSEDSARTLFALCLGAGLPVARVIKIRREEMDIGDLPAWGRQAAEAHLKHFPAGERILVGRLASELTATNLRSALLDAARSALGRRVSIGDMRRFQRHLIATAKKRLGSHPATVRRLMNSWQAIDVPPRWLASDSLAREQVVADLRDGAATRRELVRQSIEILGLRGELASMRQEIAALIGHRGDDLNLLTSLRADVEALRGRYGKLERATSGLLEREEMRYQSVRDLAFRLQELEMAREVGDSLTQAEMADLRRLTVAREERLREVLRRIDDMKSADAEMAAQVNDVSGRVGLLSVALGGLAISVGHSMPDINAALTLTDDQARWLATVATNGQAEPAGAPPR